MKDTDIKAVREKTAELINIYDKFNLPSLGKCFEETLKMLDRADREFNASLFFILMFGPLKAGKSTLTNLLARKYVSPTGFGIETTVRPSLIIKSKQPGIDVYEAVNPEDDKKELFNLVIDDLRKISTDQSFKSKVRKVPKEWSEETVKKQLLGELVIEPLITVLKVPGGDLVSEQIALIDMPGLDGVKSHWEDTYIHKWVMERADFLIFVQSSMAALNESTRKFLEKAYKRSRKPPLWLVQNVIDAKHWRSDEEREKESEDQRRKAKEDVTRELGVSEDLRSTAINLGKAWDGWEKPERFPEQLSDSHFAEFEKELKNYLADTRIRIQQMNCVKGVQTAVNNCRQEVESYEEELKSLDKKYEDQINRLVEPKKILKETTSAITTGSMKKLLKGTGRLAERIDNWVGHCVNQLLNDENLFNDLSCQKADQTALDEKMKKAVDAINYRRQEDYLEKSFAYKEIIDESTKEILKGLPKGDLISLNDCLKELQIKPFEGDFHFKPEFKSEDFKPNTLQMIKANVSFGLVKKTMKEKNFTTEISNLRTAFQTAYSDYARKMLDKMIDEISDEFDIWIQQSYRGEIEKYLEEQTSSKSDGLDDERQKISDTLAYIAKLKKEYDELEQLCEEALNNE